MIQPLRLVKTARELGAMREAGPFAQRYLRRRARFHQTGAKRI